MTLSQHEIDLLNDLDATNIETGLRHKDGRPFDPDEIRTFEAMDPNEVDNFATVLLAAADQEMARTTDAATLLRKVKPMFAEHGVTTLGDLWDRATEEQRAVIARMMQAMAEP